MRYRAALFDLDGTLLDTIEDLAESMNVALGQLGCPPRSVSQCRFLVGAGVEHFARSALPEDRRDRQTVVECVRLMRTDYAERWMSRTRVYDGIEEMLASLGERGLSLAVLSNKPHQFTVEMVEHFLGDFRFEAVYGARDDVPPKPDPAAAIEIARELDVRPGEFVYLGDTDIDMQTANAAGMFSVGVTWGFRPRAELVDNGAKLLVEHPTELIALVS